MNSIYTAQQVKAFEKSSFIKEGDDQRAMIEAAKLTVEVLNTDYPTSEFLILCGPGNNGGDGYFIGIGLSELKKSVKFIDVLGHAKKSPLCEHAFKVAEDSDFINAKTLKDISSKTVIVDAIFGIGGRIDLGSKLEEILSDCNKFESKVAIDVPTGLDSNTGEISKACFNADKTITFIGYKLGQRINEGKNYCGKLILKDLGLGMEKNVSPTVNELSFEDIKKNIPKRRENSHKGDHGKLLIIAGDEGFGGAGIMSSESGLKTGAGLVKLLTRKSHVSASLARNPEVMVSGADNAQDIEANLDWPDAIVAGPGMFQNYWSEQILYKLLGLVADNNIPTLLDAGALRLLSHKAFSKIKLHNETVLTPHPGEAAEMLNIAVKEIQKDRIKSAKALQKKYGCIIVLKGNGTIICNKNDVYLCSSGGPELAVAGSGDILSGVIGSLIAQGLAPFEAAKTGVEIHALAGEEFVKDVGEIGLAAGELISYIRKFLN
ncbi:NAD(P)H-hydrate dehydratase [Gammaproteobacteria bacterium]|nr:NAD(P)H-hydrate dehydratase [Gammaproteobacteria bacterium]